MTCQSYSFLRFRYILLWLCLTMIVIQVKLIKKTNEQEYHFDLVF